MTTTTTITAYLMSLHTYKQAALHLPMSADELSAIYTELSENGAHDVIIADAWSECAAKLDINELDNVDKLNELAEALASLDEYGQQAAALYISEGCGVEEAADRAANGEYTVYTECHDMAAVAEQYVEDTGLLEEIPECLRCYFDFAALGRDLEIEGKFCYVGSGVYIELTA
jgi:antirestriction protein